MRRLPALTLILAACGPSIVNCPPDHYRDEKGDCVPGTIDTATSVGDDDDDGLTGLDQDGDGWDAAAGDCDDTDPDVNPDAEEQLTNRTDDDCDGSIDERERSLIDRIIDGNSDQACDDPTLVDAFGTTPVRYLPVTIIRVGTTDASDIPSLSATETALDFANAAMVPAGIETFVARTEVLYDSTYNELTNADFAALRDRYDDDGTLHVFVVDTVTDADDMPADGLSAAPGGQRPHGVVIASSALSYEMPMAHLIGHALGLVHTHSGTANGSKEELVDGSNCTTAGDAICDTPADPGPSWAFDDGCAIDASECRIDGCGLDSNGDLFRPSLGNVMSAHPDTCGTGLFTPDQGARMRCAVSEDLPGVQLTDDPVLAPILEFVGFTHDDDNPGPSIGDGDGIFELGETVELTVTIRNAGAEDATGVTASLSESQPDLNLSLATVSAGTLPAGGTATAVFLASVPTTCSADFTASFTITLTDDDGSSSTDTFTLPVDCTGVVDIEATDADVAGNTIRPGTSNDFDLSIRNNGPASISGVVTDLYLSSNGTIDPATDTFICRVTDPGAIAGGATKAFTTSCTVPSVAGGGWRFGIIVDPDDDVVEANEGNNTYVDPATTQVQVPSNLTVSAVTVTPATAQPGSAVTVGYTRSNIGLGDAGAFDVDVYLSTNSTISSSDTLLCATNIAGMTAGEVAQRSLMCTVPSGAPLGTYYVGVIVDEPNDITESDENDNIASAPTQLTLEGNVDLEVTAVSFIDTNGFPGETVDLDFRMVNNGTDDAVGFYVGVLFSPDASVTSTDVEACRTTNLLDLNAGASVDLTLTGCPVPAMAMGAYTVGVFVDSSDLIDESNETNNISTNAAQFTIQGIDLTVHDVLAQTTSGAAGSVVNVGYIRENLGNTGSGPARLSIMWSTDATIDASDAQGCFFDITNSIAGDFADVFLACNVPAGLASGTYNVGVMIDSLSTVAETNEANNVATDPVLFTVP